MGELEPVTGGLIAVPEPVQPAAAATAAPPAAPAEADPPAAPAAVPAPALAAPFPAHPSALPALPTLAAPEPVAEADAFPAEAGPAGEERTSWGVVLRGGYFGLPDLIADKLFRQHPEVAGHSYGAELRYYGASGGRGVTSFGFAVDSCTAEGNGIWQPEATDQPEAFGGKITMLAFTATWYASLMPSWYVHPYVGFGLGLAKVQGDYQEENEMVTVDAWLPVLHVPLGLALELNERLQVSLEARFLDGIAAGAALQARF